MDLVRILITRSAPYTPYFIAVLVLQALSTAATLYLPSLNAKIIDEGVSQGDVDFIWRTGGIMLAVAFAQVITAIGAVWCGSRTAMGVGRDLRSQVFRHVNSLSTEDMSRFGTPTLITRSTNDVQQVQMLAMMGATMLVTAPLLAIGPMKIAEHIPENWQYFLSYGYYPVLFVALVIAIRASRFSHLAALDMATQSSAE